MMTQEYYQRAMRFAGEKHANQQVPGTQANYLLHISNVVMEVMLAHVAKADFDLNFAVQVAALHDTIEDTSASWQELSEHFSTMVADAVQALTKDSSLPSKDKKMTDSLKRITLLEKEVAIVKLADRITNLQAPPENWSREKMVAYQKEAIVIADVLEHANAYLANRLRQKINEYSSYLS